MDVITPNSNITLSVIKVLADLVILARKERSIFKCQLSERSGIPIETLRRIELGDPSIPIGDYIEVCMILKIPIFGGDSTQINNLSSILSHMHPLIPDPIVNTVDSSQENVL